MCDQCKKFTIKWWKHCAPLFVRETVIRERCKHTSQSPVPTGFAIRAVKTKLQETQALRIAGCFSCWLLTLKNFVNCVNKRCEAMRATQNAIIITSSRVTISWPKRFIMSQGKFKGLSVNNHGICGSSFSDEKNVFLFYLVENDRRFIVC